MSAVDLTEAVEAGARAHWEDTHGAKWPWEQLLADSPITAANFREGVLPVLTAAAPLIEAQVREQIARDIEAHYGPRGGNVVGPAMRLAADIARKGPR